MKLRHISSTQRKLLLAGLLAALGLLGLLVSLGLAQGGGIEFPQPGPAFIQTSGPNTQLGIGDWYTHVPTGGEPPGTGAGNPYHVFRINIPCLTPSTQDITVDLFDPEIYPSTAAIDEIRNAAHTKTQNVADADTATFTLIGANGNQVIQRTYVPTSTSDGVWVPFATFTTSAFGCGPYELRVSTSDNDDNSWKLRVIDPDGIVGTGDDPSLFAFETSFQHEPVGVISCEDYSFFVPMGTSSMSLNNFDMDYPSYTNQSSITYFPPGGGSITGRRSGGTQWNSTNNPEGLGGSALHPPAANGGDVINNPAPGWWRAQLCINDDNQYIIEPGGFLYCTGNRCPHPEMSLSAGSSACRVPGQSQLVDYTVVYTNTSTDGAGLDLVMTTTFTLPPSTTFESSNPAGCQENPAGSGIVTCLLPAVVPATQGGQVIMNLRVAPAAAATLTLTGTTLLGYEDNIGNLYPPASVTSVSQIPTCSTPPTATPTQPVPPTPTRPSTPSRHEDPTSTPPPPPPAPTVVIPPTPAVFFLPETGVNYPKSGPGLWPLALVPGLVLLGWAIFRRRGR